MRDILFTALLLACPLSMLAIGVLARAATKLRRGQRRNAATATIEQSG